MRIESESNNFNDDFVYPPFCFASAHIYDGIRKTQFSTDHQWDVKRK